MRLSHYDNRRVSRTDLVRSQPRRPVALEGFEAAVRDNQALPRSHESGDRGLDLAPGRRAGKVDDDEVVFGERLSGQSDGRFADPDVEATSVCEDAPQGRRARPPVVVARAR